MRRESQVNRPAKGRPVNRQKPPPGNGRSVRRNSAAAPGRKSPARSFSSAEGSVAARRSPLKPAGRISGEKGGLRKRTPGVGHTHSLKKVADIRGKQGADGNSRTKRLVLKSEKRPSRSMLIRELGITQERKKVPSRIEKQELIRLNRFIANAGICSRREADTYIAAGIVTVNGQIVTELGTKISPDDDVRFDNRIIKAERKVYVLLNKPKDYVTSTEDPHAERTVMELVKDACEERIYPVGRLDRNSTGLLLLTNDGDLSKRLTHPSHKVDKIYQVSLDRSVSVGDIQKIADGLTLEDGFIAADMVSFVEGRNKDTVGIEIHSGKNRIVRRIFEHLGYRVKSLDRVSFAGLTKKNIPRGKWRFLTPREVSYLKMK